MRLVVLLSVILLLLGCGTSAKKQSAFEIPETPERGGATPQSQSQAAMQQSLPQSSLQKMPASINASADPQQNRSLREIETVLRSMPSQRLSSESISLGEIFGVARRHQSVNAVLAKNGELDHLKALATLNIPPVIITRSVVGGKHVWTLVSFDDDAQMLTLANPLQRSQIKQSYSDFIKSWGEADTNRSFLLISARALTANSVKFELGKYLSSDKVARLSLTE